MTFNAAFPSSPLSRSALQGESGPRIGRNSSDIITPASPSSLFRDNSDTPGPSNLTKSRLVTNNNRRASEGVSRSLHYSPQDHNASQHYNTNHFAFSPRPHALSLSPPQTPPTRSPDSLMTPLPATSPHSFLRRSPVQRSTPFSTSRRRLSEQSSTSISGLHHSPGPSFGSFVGSYEESLLSGRMSSLPSKPLVFDAELGVLGLGKCKASLKCPPHVNFTFPAHFYSLEGASEKEKNASSSLGTPYVGTIDVEGHYLDMLLASQMDALTIPRNPILEFDINGSSKLNSNDTNMRATETFSFPGYRIPPKGQLQLVIKNPNLTAVKVFLIPYDFTDMPAGSKTFIRQKSHVAVPTRVSSTASPPPPPPSHQRAQGRQSMGRETLRYAVHLQFCAIPSTRVFKSRQSDPGFTAAGGLDRLNHRKKVDEGDSKSKKQSVMIYLHKNIRVVFAARVPDSTEKLRIVTETPGGSDGNRDNIYSTYYGPSEEWKEAKRFKREFHRQHSADTRNVVIERGREEEEGQVEEGLTEPPFNSVNSDPNGERWFSENSPGGDLSTLNGVDVPLTSRAAAWTEQEEQKRHQEAIPTRASAPITATCFPAAAFDDGNKPSSSLMHARQQNTSSDAAERIDDDRALLEQWHASLASRPQSIRPASPISPSSRTRPVSPPLARRPITPTNGFFSLLNRSGSSIGGASSGGGGGGSSSTSSSHGHTSQLPPTSPSRASSVTRSGIRPLTPQRTGDGFSAPYAPLSFARPVEASLDLDHANGTMEPQTFSIESPRSSSSRRPSLLRQLSSQNQLNTSKSGRSSPDGS